MGRWAERYTAPQRAAATAAVLDSGLSAPETSRRAATGRLLPGLEPFELNVYTLRDWVQREKRKRAAGQVSRLAREDPATAIGELLARLITLAEKEIKRAEKRAKGIEAGELARLADSLAKIHTLAAKLHTPEKPGPPNDDNPAPEPTSLTARLQARHNAHPPPNPTQTTERPRTRATNQPTDPAGNGTAA